MNAVEKGSWSDKVHWEFFTSSRLPPAELCTAVFCVAIIPDSKEIVLTRVERGWGMLGGHIEEGETMHEALIRESQEEGGFTPVNPRLLGYKKITSTEPIPHQNPTKMYPFPTSYIVYYWSTTDRPLVSPHGSEVLESARFSFDQIAALKTSDVDVIERGYSAFLRTIVV